MKNLISIGFRVDKDKGYVTGLAMMHDLFLDIARENGFKVTSISLNSDNNANGVMGNVSFKRYVDYISIMIKVCWAFISKRNAIFYLNPSTAKAGFYRDSLLIFIAKFFGHKVFMQQFGALFESFKNSLSHKEEKILEKVYNRADVLVVEGNFAKTQYPFIKDQDKIKVIQNGLPENDKSIVKKAKTYNDSKPFNLFFMNNMIESKGYIDVLKAVSILINEKHRNITCTFAGKFMSVVDDTYFKNQEDAKVWFDNFIKDNNLQSYVSYYNCVFNEEKIIQFQKAHAFLLPSYYIFEGQPTAILEALSYGCVPVVTNYRLIPDMVNTECGIFVEPKNPNSIVEAIEKLIDNPTIYNDLSNCCIKVFDKKFTREAYSKKIAEELNNI